MNYHLSLDETQLRLIEFSLQVACSLYRQSPPLGNAGERAEELTSGFDEALSAVRGSLRAVPKARRRTPQNTRVLHS